MKYDITESIIERIIPPRERSAHKGLFGHALLICGSQGMMGAAVLVTGAALRSGCGLVTTHVPFQERAIIHIKNPSAMVSCDPGTCFSVLPTNLEKYSCIGIGSGLGTAEITKNALESLLSSYVSPMVIDADAINILSKNRDLLRLVPSMSVFTPHVGELKRLIGDWVDDDAKFKSINRFTSTYNCYIILKGSNTAVCTPEGDIWINHTGNPGMAKGGSGDVLTGFLTGLLARGLSTLEASISAVYFHGKAGDVASQRIGEESMNSEDILSFLRI